MDSPYDSPEPTASPRRGPAFRRLAGWAFVAATVFATLVFFLNFMGCCLYLFTNIGSSDAILGGGIGVLHVAIAPHQDMTDLANDPMMQSLGPIPGLWHTDLLRLGPFHLFAEPPGESFQPLRFDSSSGDGYTAVEFPLLILIAAFGALGWLLLRRRRVLN